VFLTVVVAGVWFVFFRSVDGGPTAAALTQVFRRRMRGWTHRQPARVKVDPEVAEYPDRGKVGIWIGDKGRFFRVTDAVEHAGPE
jgi:hypothetical protein